MHPPTEVRKHTAPESERHDDLRGYLLSLYAALVSSQAPPADTIGRFLRMNPSLRGAPGRFLAASASAMLRARVRTLTAWQWADRDAPLFDWPEPMAPPAVLAPADEAAAAMGRWLMEDCGSHPDDALRLTRAALVVAVRDPLFSAEEPASTAAEWIGRFARDPHLSRAPELVQTSARRSVPRDIVERWRARFGPRGADALFESLRRPAPLDLRANTLKAKRRDVLAMLREAGIAGHDCPWSRDGIRLAHKANVKGLPQFRDGLFEIQDEGSQLVALALSPSPGWRVLDACAGGGGKTLHLAALMANKGEIFANDSSEERLEGLRRRLGKSGASCVRFLAPGEAAGRGPYDAVLVDAPCLGFGTLRRSPELMWRGALSARIADATTLQKECLAAYAPLVKPGGVLVYAVCSFEPEETTAMGKEIARMGFRPDRLAGAQHFPRSLSKSHDATLLPSEHDTDGFYMARFVKAS